MSIRNPQGGSHIPFSIDTVTATAALRDQMRAELNEVEEFERRSATALTVAPNQQAKFLLAASYLIERDSALNADEALEIIRARFVEGAVQESLRQVKEKWRKEWYFRPEEYTLGDQREKEMVAERIRLHEEEQADILDARNMVNKMLNFVTCEGKLLDDWKEAFNERAKVQKNGNIWTPKQFDKVLVDFGEHIIGTVVPEGMGETVYNFLDTEERRLLHIDIFYSAVKDAATLYVEEKKKRDLPTSKDIFENEKDIDQKTFLQPNTDEELGLDSPNNNIKVKQNEQTLNRSPNFIKDTNKSGIQNIDRDVDFIHSDSINNANSKLVQTSSPYVWKGEETEDIQIQKLTKKSQPKLMPWYRKMLSKVVSSWSNRRWRKREAKMIEQKLILEKQTEREKALVEKERMRIMKDVENLQTELESVKLQAKIALESEQRMKEQMNEVIESGLMSNEDKLSAELRLLPIDLYKKGCIVRVNFAGRGHYYPGRIICVNEDSDTFKIQYMDGDLEDNVPRQWVLIVGERGK
jgi:hypothetical protein